VIECYLSTMPGSLMISEEARTGIYTRNDVTQESGNVIPDWCRIEQVIWSQSVVSHKNWLNLLVGHLQIIDLQQLLAPSMFKVRQSPTFPFLTRAWNRPPHFRAKAVSRFPPQLVAQFGGRRDCSQW